MLKSKVIVLALLFVCGVWTAARGQGLNDVLARMDKEAGSFHDMTARLKKAEFTSVLNDTTTETGEIWLKRAGKEILMRTEISQPEPRSIGFEDSRASIYYPKINTVQIYDLGKSRSLIDQFLVLGFGSTGKEMAKNYSIALAGDEAVNGEACSRLELVPKDKKVLDQVRKVELWIPADSGHPIQQRFLQPGGDYYLVTYSSIKMNPNIPDTAFRLKLPAGVKKEYPQK